MDAYEYIYLFQTYVERIMLFLFLRCDLYKSTNTTKH
ncbi:hypothetical protein EcWSU1_00863 [Enterobacter ludwigii]|uniref:Uncharacterized protein n=1 Tax=Enterobacter ludwigii TaxID=299767 RepID=G8LP43_9ENTR|nr:hypothetical protein EcWSU1_00863 [Enterobacter ludwigii]